MEFSVQFQKLCQMEARRYILIVGMVSLAYLMLQSLMLPYGDALKSLFPDNKVMIRVRSGFPSGRLSVESESESEIDPSTLDRDQSNSYVFAGRDDRLDDVAGDIQDISVTAEGKSEDKFIGLTKEGEVDPSNLVGGGKGHDHSNVTLFVGSYGGLQERDTSTQDDTASERNIQDEALQSTEDNNNQNEISTQESVDLLTEDSSVSKPENADHTEQIIGTELHGSSERSLESNGNSSSDGNENGGSWSQAGSENMEELPESDVSLLSNELDMIRTHCSKFRDGGPPKSVTPIDKMNQIFAQYLASSSNMVCCLSTTDLQDPS